MLENAAMSAVLNVVIFAGIPFAIYYAYQKDGTARSQGGRTTCRTQLGESRYLVYCLAFSLFRLRFS